MRCLPSRLHVTGLLLPGLGCLSRCMLLQLVKKRFFNIVLFYLILILITEVQNVETNKVLSENLEMN